MARAQIDIPFIMQVFHIDPEHPSRLFCNVIHPAHAPGRNSVYICKLHLMLHQYIRNAGGKDSP